MLKTLQKLNQGQIGFTFAILDMFTFGLLPIVSHYFVRQIDPLIFAGASTLIGSIPLLFWLRKNKKLNQLSSPTYLPNLLCLSFLATISSVCYFVGTKYTSGFNTGLLTQIEPVYAMLLGIFLLKEVINFNQVIATLLMIAGAVAIVYKGSTGLNIGDVLILLSPLLMQISHLFAKKVYSKNADSNLVPTARLLFSGILLLVIAAVTNPSSFTQLLSASTLLNIIVFGLIFRCLDFILWYQAIARISVSSASAVIPLAIAISFVGSIFFLKESITNNQLLGLLSILIGLIWLSKANLKEKKDFS